MLPSECADSAVSLHEASQRAAERADEAIARGDLEAGYASIEEAYAALDALHGRREAYDLDVHARSHVEAAKADPRSARSEILLLCRVFVHLEGVMHLPSVKQPASS